MFQNEVNHKIDGLNIYNIDVANSFETYFYNLHCENKNEGVIKRRQVEVATSIKTINFIMSECRYQSSYKTKDELLLFFF